MDSSQAPLIAGNRDDEELEYDVAEGPPAEPGKSGSERPTVFVLALTFAACISGLLFGCKLLMFLFSVVECFADRQFQMIPALCRLPSSPSEPPSRTAN